MEYGSLDKSTVERQEAKPLFAVDGANCIMIEGTNYDLPFFVLTVQGHCFVAPENQNRIKI